MRIICCVHAPDEHWMRHLSSAARVATVCRRLRWVQSGCLVPAPPKLPLTYVCDGASVNARNP